MKERSIILFLMGLPGSGKSTYAKILVNTPNTNWVRINKDDLRGMLFDGKYSRSRENFVLDMRDCAIRNAAKCGRDIIIDDTNLHPKHRKKIEALAQELDMEFQVKLIDTPLEECIRRDSKRKGKANVGEKVILGMYNDYLKT